MTEANLLSGARATVEALERILLGVRAAPRTFELDKLALGLEEALSAATEVRDSVLGQARLDRLDAALTRVRLARRLVDDAADSRWTGSLAALEVALDKQRRETIDEIVSKQDEALRSGRAGLSSNEHASAPARADWSASQGLPRLRTIPRSPVQARVTWGPRDDDFDEPPRSLAELVTLAMASTEEPVADQPAAAGEEDSLAREVDNLARLHFVELASLAALRRRNDDEDWYAVGAFEQRILGHLDALLALGAAEPGTPPRPRLLARVLEIAAEGVSTDAGRAFARALVLGCVSGEDAARAATFSMRSSHPYTWDAQAEALSLAPSTDLGPALASLLREDEPALLCATLSALRFRREGELGQLIPLLAHPAGAVVAAAVSILGTRPSFAAHATCEEIAADFEGELPGAVASEALARLGDAAGLIHAHRALDRAAEGEAGDVYRHLLAVVGDEGVLGHLVDRRGNAADVRLLGWLGREAAIEPLLTLFDATRQVRPSGLPLPLEVAIVEALHRISGFELYVPEGEEPPTLVTTRLCLEPALWRDTWRSARLPAGRLRYGKAHSPQIAVAEAALGATSPADRRTLELELGVMTKGESLFEPTDWVVRQAKHLDDLRRRFEGR